MPLYFSCISYSSFGSEMAKCSRQSLQPCKFLTGNNTRWTIDQVYRLHCFCRARTSEDYRSYDQLIKITRACIKFIGSRSIQESFRFPTKQYFYFGGSYHLYAATCCIFQALQRKMVLKKPCLKSDIKSTNLRLTKI